MTNADASLVTQLVGIVAVGAFITMTSTLAWLTLKATVGIRVSKEVEIKAQSLTRTC